MKNIIIDNIEYKLVPVEKEEGKDYEIMSFILNSNGAILTKRSNGKYVYGHISKVGEYTEEDILSNDRKRTDWEEDEEGFGYSVHSVKRLSDGEIFTIGDMCNPIGEYSYNKKPITKIWFTDGGILRISSENYTLDINEIEHSKMPLFTSDFEIIDWEGDKENFHIGDTILSVKRKSDNVTFKIGDRIKEGVIINIIINKGKIYLEI